VKRFNVEGRNRRSALKAQVQRAWTARTDPVQYAAIIQKTTPRQFGQTLELGDPCPDGLPNSLDQDVMLTPFEVLNGTPCTIDGAGTMSDLLHALDNFLSLRLDSGGILDIHVAFDEFMALQLDLFDQALDDNKRLFLDEIYRRVSAVAPVAAISDELRQRRTAALWTGLRRVFFHEVESETDDSAVEDEDPTWFRRRRPRIPHDGQAPANPSSGKPDDPDDASMDLGANHPPSTNATGGERFESSSTREYSNGEDEINDQLPNGEPMNGEPSWRILRRHFVSGHLPNGKPMNGEKITQFDAAKAFLGESKRMWNNVGRKIFLSVKTIRRILVCKDHPQIRRIRSEK
jgi:hypothetical protein